MDINLDEVIKVDNFQSSVAGLLIFNVLNKNINSGKFLQP